MTGDSLELTWGSEGQCMSVHVSYPGEVKEVLIT